MTTDWKPKAPSAKKAFSQTKTEKTAGKDQGSGPVTKAELDRLTAQRDRPDSARALAPDGAGQRASDLVRRHREERIAHIRNRLRRVKNRARDDFDRSR